MSENLDYLDELRERIKERYDVSDLIERLDPDIDTFIDLYFDDILKNTEILEELGIIDETL